MEDEQEQNQQEISQLEKKLSYMKADYAQVVYNAYRNRRLMDKVTFILASDDFSQMFRRLRYYAIFSRNVREQSERIVKTTEELTKKNEELVSLRNDKLNTLSSKEQEIKSLEIDRRKKTQNAEKLKKESKKLNDELKKKQQQRKDIDAAIQRAVKEEIARANAEREKKAKAAKGKSSGTSSSPKSGTSPKSSATISLTPEEQNLNTSFINNKGKLPWPVAKGAKVSDFGSYPHPDVPSVQVENHGIDIMVEAGTPARAVFEGVVTGVMNIMGTTVVMVRHGEYLTVYQNLSSASVKKGDKVSTKQTLGTVAKSSSSNTYELHFEVWKNDRYVNPNEWLARK